MSSNALDDAVLALLDADDHIVLVQDPNTPLTNKVGLYDGHVTDSDEVEKTIGVPLPYLIFFSTPGMPARARAGRSSTLRVVEFQLTGVGEDRWQAKWASELAERLLDGRTAEPDGEVARRIRRTPDNLFVARDDTWTRPDGRPLFMCSARYTAATKR